MNTGRLYSVIIGPHVSEKTTALHEAGNQYAFKVAIDASKQEIQAAVEELFDVDVDNVQVLKVKGKTKRTARRTPRKRSDWKKAYVRVADGQSIDFGGEVE